MSQGESPIQWLSPSPVPVPDNKTVQIFCQRQKQRHITIACCQCVRVCAQIEFDLLKFDIFRDTSTANQANTSQEQRQDESDRQTQEQSTWADRERGRGQGNYR